MGIQVKLRWFKTDWLARVSSFVLLLGFVIGNLGAVFGLGTLGNVKLLFVLCDQAKH